jgi:hypothetical protein
MKFVNGFMEVVWLWEVNRHNPPHPFEVYGKSTIEGEARVLSNS